MRWRENEFATIFNAEDIWQPFAQHSDKKCWIGTADPVDVAARIPNPS